LKVGWARCVTKGKKIGHAVPFRKVIARATIPSLFLICPYLTVLHLSNYQRPYF